MDKERTVLITGGTNGKGKATAYELSLLDYKMTIVGQTKEKCMKVAETIQFKTGNLVQWIVSDLSTLKGNKSTASQSSQNNKYLHVLINNAGAFFNQRILPEDGLEKTFALNQINYYI